jgi:cell division inhibitor SepF
MSSSFGKFLDFMKLSDSEYEDDFEDEAEEEKVEEEPVKEAVKKEKKTSNTSRFGRKTKKAAENKIEDDFSDYSDIDDDDDEIPEPPVKRSSFRRSSSGRSSDSGSSRIVSMSRSSRGGSGMEVRVCRPSDFESCQEISDIILSGRAAVINFDLVSLEDAQRIIDFVSGSCYAINGTVKQVADKIVIFTPNDIDITGDFMDAASSAVTVPAFDLYGDD